MTWAVLWGIFPAILLGAFYQPPCYWPAITASNQPVQLSCVSALAGPP
jgi:hypothetical protein